jgi:hypothetical protein
MTLVMMAVGAAIVLRDPYLLAHPRFWAEEGTSYFQSALSHSVLGGLLNVTAAPHNPYFHAVPQISTVLAAHLSPLERAPLVTTLSWALVLYGVELVAVYSRAELMDPLPVRLSVIVAPLLAVGAAENWGNTLGAHFYADVALLLLLLEAPRVEGRRRAAGLVAFVFFAFITPSAFLVAPAAVALCASSWKARRGYAIALGASLLLQVLVRTTGGFPGRTLLVSAALPHVFVAKLLLWPFFGASVANAYGAWALALSEGRFLAFAFAVAIVGGAIFVAAARWGARDESARVLLFTWLAAAGGYLFLGLGVERGHLASVYNGGRYAFLPSMIAVMFLAHVVWGMQGNTRRSKVLFGVALAAALVVGVAEYPFPPGVETFMHGPRWLPEVKKFRSDPTYDRLQIAPAGWAVTVPRDAR